MSELNSILLTNGLLNLYNYDIKNCVNKSNLNFAHFFERVTHIVISLI